MKVVFNKKFYSIGETVLLDKVIVTITMELVKNNPGKFNLLDRYYKCINVNSQSLDPDPEFKKFTKEKIYQGNSEYVLNDNNDLVDISTMLSSVYGEPYFTLVEPATEEDYKNYPKMEILRKYKEKYPIGTRVKSPFNGKIATISSKRTTVGYLNLDGIYYMVSTGDVLAIIEGEKTGVHLRCNKKDAEIIHPIFELEGKKIYPDDTVYVINPLDKIIDIRAKDLLIGQRVFLTSEKAKEYKDSFQKPLFFYRQQIVNNSELSERILYRMILEEISKDLNPHFLPEFNRSKWFIYQ